MEVVDENTQLEVGKHYFVPCAKMAVYEHYIYVPILGKPHADPQFNVRHEHYHIDGRFASEGLYKVDKHGKTNSIIAVKGIDFHGIEVIRMTCKRLTTGIDPPKRPINNQHIGGAYYAWYDSMVGKSCKGKRCPHLGTLMHEQNGVLICPLHNLKGSKETELII